MNAILEIFNRQVRTGIAKNIENIPDKQVKRFHINELIELPSGETIVITNQWSLDNITRLVEFMNNASIEVEKVE